MVTRLSLLSMLAGDVAAAIRRRQRISLAAGRGARDGKRVAYLCAAGGGTKVCCRWMDTGQTAELATVTDAAGLAWAPDGKSIALAQFVPEKVKPFVELPGKPEGAEWAAPFKMI